jgi:hypothetical protein
LEVGSVWSAQRLHQMHVALLQHESQPSYHPFVAWNPHLLYLYDCWIHHQRSVVPIRHPDLHHQCSTDLANDPEVLLVEHLATTILLHTQAGIVVPQLHDLGS